MLLELPLELVYSLSTFWRKQLLPDRAPSANVVRGLQDTPAQRDDRERTEDDG
jgi:hypothetical protein